ncbi:MAG TPA: hypothetical protein VK943_13085 [Arenibaculum sp.]|nr:hypothetical protein [Arenibaculum sp.]
MSSNAPRQHRTETQTTSGKKTDEVQALIGRLNPVLARRLLAELGNIPERNPARAALIRDALNSVANRMRTQHARRAFYGLFEPFLSHRADLLDPMYTPPGFIHRVDIGGLWKVLSTGPLQGTARAHQQLLEDELKRTPGRDLMETPAAAAAQEALRAEAAAHLNDLLGTSKAFPAFLEAVNRARESEAKRLGLGKVRVVAREDIGLYRSILVFNEFVTAATQNARRQLSHGEAPDLHVDVMTAVAEMANKKGWPATVGALPVLALVCDSRDFGILGRCLRSRLAPPLTAVLVEAVERHFSRSCTDLAAAVSAAFADTASKGLVAPDEETRRQLDRELARFDELLGIVVSFDLFNEPNIGERCRNHLAASIRTVEERVYPALIERGIQRAIARDNAPDEQEALTWTLDYVSRWRESWKDPVFWGTRFTEFRNDFVDFMRDTFRKAVARNDYPSAADKFRHLLRINVLARCFGGRMTDWIGPLDHNVVQLMIERLRETTAIDAEEAAIFRTFAAAAAEELARIKYWKDPLLLTFTDLARERLAQSDRAEAGM